MTPNDLYIYALNITPYYTNRNSRACETGSNKSDLDLDWINEINPYLEWI